MSTHFYPLPRSHPYKALRAPVKVTVNALAAGCQSFYRKIYGHYYSAALNLSRSAAMDMRKESQGSPE